MKAFKTLIAAAALAIAGSAWAQSEPADVFVKRISTEVIDAAKADKDVQAGNQKKVMDLVEAKILPFVDFQRMTSLAAGRYWKDATPEQQKALTAEFRTLLVNTYSNAISQIKNQTVEFKPLRADPADQEVEVRSQVIQPRGEPIQLNYRVAKAGGAWKIYDINVLGAWLVEAYKGTFQNEITKGGFDGLIKALSEKNKKLAAAKAK